ncbi:MAG: Rieske (2Fe-2S) protein [Opitutaceae bacterium]
MAKHPVAKVSELPPGARRLVRVGNIEVGLFHVEGRIVAYRNVCPHAGAPVCVGRISGTSLPSAVYDYQYGHEGCILRCPWHGWEFDLRTGEHLVDPSTRLKAIPVVPPASPASEQLEPIPIEREGDSLCLVLPGESPNP